MHKIHPKEIFLTCKKFNQRLDKNILHHLRVELPYKFSNGRKSKERQINKYYHYHGYYYLHFASIKIPHSLMKRLEIYHFMTKNYKLCSKATIHPYNVIIISATRVFFIIEIFML